MTATRTDIPIEAAVGFANASDTYEKYRPDYPEAAVAFMLSFAGVTREKGTLLDLAAGTGKLTRMLEGRVARVVAVEPVAQMRAELGERAPFAELLDGTAEHIPLADASMDAVFVAQAFHWFDGPRALAEIRRVLRPGGALALIWNCADRRVAWLDALQLRLDDFAGDAPRHRANGWREAFEGETGFSPLELSTFEFAQPIASLDDLAGRTASVSYIAALPSETREAFLGEVRALGAAHQVTSYPYVTEVHVARRA